MTERDITRGGGESLHPWLQKCGATTGNDETVASISAGEPTTAPEGPSVGTEDEVRSALNPLPEGNRATVVVPVEPTREMILAGFQAPHPAYEPADPQDIWSAMLSAAPPSVVGASEPVATLLADLAKGRDGRAEGDPVRGEFERHIETVNHLTAQPLEAENRSLREALALAANRMDRLSLEARYGTAPHYQAVEWADEARQALSRFPEQEGATLKALAAMDGSLREQARSVPGQTEADYRANIVGQTQSDICPVDPAELQRSFDAIDAAPTEPEDGPEVVL